MEEFPEHHSEEFPEELGNFPEHLPVDFIEDLL